MHFDDRLRTVLQDVAPQGAAAVAQYRQIVDLLAQLSSDMTEAEKTLAYERIAALGGLVAEPDRLATVQCLTGRIVSSQLVAMLSRDTAQIANAAIRAARLSDAQWSELVPRLSARARGLLRHRRDLGPLALASLERFAVQDRALPANDMISEAGLQSEDAGWNVASAPAAEDEVVLILSNPIAEAEAEPTPPTIARPQAGTNISEILARVEALRRMRAEAAYTAGAGMRGLAAQAPELPLGLVDSDGEEMPIRFRTDIDGRIVDAAGAPLGALFGLSLAHPARPLMAGVDAAVASAFARRLPIRAGHLAIEPAQIGDTGWRLDADPCFVSSTGRFSGYAGIIRRPEAAEQPDLPQQRRAESRRDALRQVLHELRTPLNAIQGFGEMIEQQMFGPAAQEYRALAARIVEDARYLLSGFEDLDTALRLDRGALAETDGAETRADTLIGVLEERLTPLIASRAASLMLDLDPDLPAIAWSGQALERTVLRLAGAMVSVAEADETIRFSIKPLGPGQLAFAIARPHRLAGMDRDALLDPDRAVLPDGVEGPLLGLGFSLRLVERLARLDHGRLDIGGDALVLVMPAVMPAKMRETVPAD